MKIKLSLPVKIGLLPAGIYTVITLFSLVLITATSSPGSNIDMSPLALLFLPGFLIVQTLFYGTLATGTVGTILIFIINILFYFLLGFILGKLIEKYS
ncbi:MAG: hypothetical protein COU31_04275 [Candidatus Magasanikbacteria bacterium CG10_big_fil_rev_8_21_14_0_10_40_10]|uniref:Uncharacterized protein n=1 Tax=Candidatus Magasanikbacteria bacterium CG10_big_fil_rev_8_21_14_0_10_40_10 TaxID=1974648 RepID=A0A2M6W2Y0_9BACT|nr:MAG: hypothetical protein COU31_04275 [Candidatus Magasanikbacteria bacterium CG10_big_fil_rev_8_21_14_0_10_40_10]